MPAPYPSNPAPTDAPIADLLAARWSPVHFSDEPLGEDVIRTLFEGARWAPSSFNEQPWLYVYAEKGDPNREEMESLLVPGNAWAKNAGLLIVSFGKKRFAKNDKPNYHHLHDTGAASVHLALQATDMGLLSHQMEGFDRERANGVCGVPDTHVPGSMIAIGYPGDPGTISEEHKKRESAPRQRKKVSEFAFRTKYQ